MLVAACSLAVLMSGGAGEAERVELENRRVAETSFRTDLVHPYGTMHPANSKFINPNGAPEQALNPAPAYPYHSGHRPWKVLHTDFEHAPYGNKVWWRHLPEGALAKDVQKRDEPKDYKFMVNRDGVVTKWEYDLPLERAAPGSVGNNVLNALSPMPEPEPSRGEVAQALEKRQKREISESFRSIYPTGMFHDSIVDGKTGKEIPMAAPGKQVVECPAGLYQCLDDSCVAHVSYCPGCDVTPVPAHCSAVAAKKSGWRPSAIDCDLNNLPACGSHVGDSVHVDGEAVNGGLIVGGLG
eukprot:CAMPEP_0184309130 /NCGR_PEP_ID=MMETSP1049-20130417/17389_1 /TAXON_ID=77928 /ORGANISM="Proteomonas sulcata, Strain CCMP704" /LENGTH=296 /DNA_ID=CAMNT_0026621957 /DNA_START=10 /DNA_END=900 /DNA_ORIENTATION=+